MHDYLEDSLDEIAERHGVDRDTVGRYAEDRIREMAERGEITASLAAARFPQFDLPEPVFDARSLWGSPPVGSMARTPTTSGPTLVPPRRGWTRL